jgi:hypothetical protein
MGSGKTSAILQKIRLERNKRFLYITPYISEINRIIEQDSTFKQPMRQNKFHLKLDDLNCLLEGGNNVVTSHALFLMANKRTEQLIVKGDYILIMDEAIETLHLYNSDQKKSQGKIMSVDDSKFLIDNHFIEIDNKYNVNWVSENETGMDFSYSEIKRLADRKMLKCINGKFFWEYSSDIFNWFSEIYILTYQFDGTELSCYFKANGFEYDKVSAERYSGGFRLCDYSDGHDQMHQISKLISIHNGKYNKICKKDTSFSVNDLRKRKSDGINEIKKAMRNFKDSVRASSDMIMWTTTKQFGFYEKLESAKGFKYTHRLTSEEKDLPENEQKKFRQFVPCNVRATNDYNDRTVLMYILNFYTLPEHKEYFQSHGIQLDEDRIALNALIQWIWRSAIRNGKPIYLFIPSSRMRRLLCEWLEIEPF